MFLARQYERPGTEKQVDATEKDTQAFSRGVFEGHNAAMANVRSIIGRALKVRR